MTYTKAISRYLNGECKDFSEIYSLGFCKSKILKRLNQYAKLYPSTKDEINKIIDNIDELMNSKFERENFLDVIISISNTDNGPVFVDLIKSLLISTENEAIEIIRKRQMSKKDYDELLKKLKKRFPNQLEEYNYLVNLYNKYVEKYNISKEKKNKKYVGNLGSSIYVDKYKQIDLKLLSDIYNSNLCVEEYCSKYGNTISAINRNFDKIEESKYKKYKPLIIEIKKRDNSDFLRYIVYVTYKLYQMDNFDMIDYLNYTNLDVKNFNDLMNKLNFDKKLTKELYTKLRHCSMERRSVNINKEHQLEIETVIANRVITREEKEMIFDYLESNNYSINLYRVALNKYLNGKLDLSRHTLVK